MRDCKFAISEYCLMQTMMEIQCLRGTRASCQCPRSCSCRRFLCRTKTSLEKTSFPRWYKVSRAIWGRLLREDTHHVSTCLCQKGTRRKPETFAETRSRRAAAMLRRFDATSGPRSPRTAGAGYEDTPMPPGNPRSLSSPRHTLENEMPDNRSKRTPLPRREDGQPGLP